MIEFHEMTAAQLAAEEGPLDFEDECRCPIGKPMRHTLSIEEGTAYLRHDACGLRSWLYQEDIYAEFPVMATIKVCTERWHGDMVCECGPEVEIRLADEGEADA